MVKKTRFYKKRFLIISKFNAGKPLEDALLKKIREFPFKNKFFQK